jgi:glycosyltransferase involved in cell wall biosynthesis
MATPLAPRRVLIIIENLPAPFDRRVWQEARTLVAAGCQVTIICPTGKGHEADHEFLEGIHIYRHPLPLEAHGAMGYVLEYGAALWHEFRLSFKVLRRHGFDAVHACNPPDLIFLVGGFFRLLFGKRFLFDHHDINPELYEAKFGRRDVFWRLMLLCEWLTFKTAQVVISTNESYRQIALTRGKKKPEDVFVVRSGPSLDRLKIVPPEPSLKRGRAYLVGYVGVIGQQEGIQYLIEAARHLIITKGRQDIHFGIVGGGPALAEMQALAAARGVGDYFTFTGRVPDGELLAMLNTADVCVNPDEANPMNDKSTMNKIMEYMALGKPIVQFDLTEGRFSAQDASLYAKPNDAVDLAEKIAELLDDPAKRAAMGAYGQRRVQAELQWPYEAPKLLAAYDRLFTL